MKAKPALKIDLVESQTLAAIQLLKDENAPGTKLGAQTKEGWQETIDNLTKMGQIEAEVDTDGIYTGEYLPE